MPEHAHGDPQGLQQNVIDTFNSSIRWTWLLRDDYGFTHAGSGMYVHPDGIYTLEGTYGDERLVTHQQGREIVRTKYEFFALLVRPENFDAAIEALLAALHGDGVTDLGPLPNDALDRLHEAAGIAANDQPAILEPATTVVVAPDGASLAGAGNRPKSCQPLDAVQDFLMRYVVLPGPHDYSVVTVWLAHTYLMKAFDTTPRLAFLSPQSSSGKTRAIELLSMLVNAPVSSIDSTTAALFRGIHNAGGRMTLLLDEVDTIFQPGNVSAEAIRGILNSGYKRGATVHRAGSQRKGFQVESFEVFAPVALAGLGTLPATLMARSVVMRMRPRTVKEPLEPYRRREVEPEAARLKAELEAWCVDNADRVCIPKLPDEVQDREAEVWEPLIAVADLAGGEWAQTLRVAAVAAVAGYSDTKTYDTRLLAGIRTVFDDCGKEQLATKDLIKGLEKSELVSSRDLTPEKLARTLGPYGIRSKNLRIGDKVPKGYERSAFEDSWSRYLPE